MSCNRRRAGPSRRRDRTPGAWRHRLWRWCRRRLPERWLEVGGALRGAWEDLNDRLWPTRSDWPAWKRRPFQPALEQLEPRWLFSTGLVEYAGAVTPLMIASGPDGALWFTEFNNATIGRITTSGSMTHYGVRNGGSQPYDIISGPLGKLWFTESTFILSAPVNTCSIEVMNPDGTMYAEYVISNSPGGEPHGLCQGPDGNVWFCMNGSNQIGRITPGGSITLWNLPGGVGSPEDITAGTDGNLWFTLAGTSQIGRITTGGTITEWNTPTPSSDPQGIAVGPDGCVWFCEYATSKLGRVVTGPTVSMTDYATPHAGPFDLVTGPDQNLWFTELNNNLVAWRNADGAYQEILANSGGPKGITVGPDSDIWLTEDPNNPGKIAKIGYGAQTYLRTDDLGCRSDSYTPLNQLLVSPNTGDLRFEDMPDGGCGCDTGHAPDD